MNAPPNGSNGSAPPDQNAMQQQLQALMQDAAAKLVAHFRKLGVAPICIACRSENVGVAGLPCAAISVVPTANGMQPMPGLPIVPLISLACHRCGLVSFYSLGIAEENAASPLVKLSR